MEQVHTRNWIEYIWVLPVIGAILVLISIITPATAIMESGVFIFLQYFGFWFLSSGGITDFGMASDFFASPYNVKYMTIGLITIGILTISLILMFVSVTNAKDKKNHKIAAATSLIGGILPLIGIGAYYFYLKQEFLNFWILFDPSFGFYLPLVAGIVGIVGAIAAVYAFSVESNLPEERVLIKPIFKPQSVAPPTIETGVSVQSQHERQKFCKNCGVELIGIFCKECGTKAE